MGLHDQRIAPPFLEVERVEEQAFDRHTVGAQPFHSLLPGQLIFLREVLEKVCDSSRCRAAPFIQHPNVAGVTCVGDLKDMPLQLGVVGPTEHGVIAVGELNAFFARRVDPEEILP